MGRAYMSYTLEYKLYNCILRHINHPPGCYLQGENMVSFRSQFSEEQAAMDAKFQMFCGSLYMKSQELAQAYEVPTTHWMYLSTYSSLVLEGLFKIVYVPIAYTTGEECKPCIFMAK
ncbi:uncharacterized protein LOC141623741 isoform X3 [Silene latifolia]|uniref:uncharacterized protein LOC141623741 isoform X3 n=1 Tax=Silene latifolia TaxID=37657 RepID=UPI003D76E2FB